MQNDSNSALRDEDKVFVTPKRRALMLLIVLALVGFSVTAML